MLGNPQNCTTFHIITTKTIESNLKIATVFFNNIRNDVRFEEKTRFSYIAGK